MHSIRFVRPTAALLAKGGLPRAPTLTRRRTRGPSRLGAAAALLLCACGVSPLEPGAQEPPEQSRSALEVLGAPPAGTIYNVEPNDRFVAETTIGNVYYARTAPLLADQPYGWWSRLDVGFTNGSAGSLTVTGFELDSNAGPAQLRPLTSPVVVAAGDPARMRVPQAISGTGTPSTLAVKVLLSGGQSVTRNLGFHRFEAPTPSGGFRFPARAQDLAPGEYWLADEHKDSEGQAFAYDFNVVRWTGSAWTDIKAGGSTANHLDHLIWGKPVYAIADGWVVRCARTVADDIDGDGGGGNTIIQDIGDGQYLSYHHMKQNSVSLEHCPSEGVGPGDDPAPLHIWVRAGTKLGEVGHSGASSGPHLHLQLSDGLPGGPDKDKLRSLPLAFHNVDVHRKDNSDDASDPNTWTRLHADTPAALHVESPAAYLVAPNRCGWLAYDSSASEVTHHGISAACYQDVVAAVVEAGFRLVHVDGYDVGGQTFFNAVWRPADGVTWAARHGLTSAQYQSTVGEMLALGLQVLHVDSYLSGGSVRYAAIFRAGLAPRAAYHGLTAAEHQQRVDSWPGLGYHPVSISVLSLNGVRQYTAVWEKSAFPNWVLDSAISSAQLSGAIAAQALAGRRLWALDAYRHNGAVQFAALFGASGAATSVSPQNTSANHQTEMGAQRAAGHDTRLVTGVESGGLARFVGVWAN